MSKERSNAEEILLFHVTDFKYLQVIVIYNNLSTPYDFCILFLFLKMFHFLLHQYGPRF